MGTTTELATIQVALIGNPNVGKSTLFSALAGVRQRVGNYPGVTVEKKVGTARIGGRRFAFVDLPGTYSLAPRSPDEMVAVDVLLNRQEGQADIDVVLCIVDASNLERNLYLVSQLLELERPTVLAVNMVDVAEARGLELDLPLLAERLGIPVVPVQAHRQRGLAELRDALVRASAGGAVAAPKPFPEPFREEVDRLAAQLASEGGRWPRYLVERLLLDTSGYLERHGTLSAAAREEITAARQRLSQQGHSVPAVEAISRYGWVSSVLDGVVRQPAERPASWSDRIDQVLTHRVWGTLFFALTMLLMFQSIFAWATPMMDWIERGMGVLGDAVAGLLSEGALRSLMVDGVVGGVGGVLVFLPQIMILFLFIAILEDCGYMARAAYLMDKLMSRVGLSGKSFIPLLSSFACAIPGIMAARVIENRRDRLATILVAPLMSCSARLPVYILLTAAFIPDRALGGWLRLQALTIAGMYLLGILAAVAAAWVFKRWLFPGETPPFVMELPPYKLPSVRGVVLRVTERGWAFVYRAGTLILAVSIVIWALSYYPRNPQLEVQLAARLAPRIESLQAQRSAADPDEQRRLDAQLAALDAEQDRILSAAQMRQSFLGRMGQWIEPVVRPLGWDWRIGASVIASFPAREVVIGAMGVIYNLGDDQEEAFEPLKDRLREVTWEGTERPVFNIPVALSIMVFFALCAQCAATLVVIRRETNQRRWALFTFAYMTVLAYVAALVTYQVGMWISNLA